MSQSRTVTASEMISSHTITSETKCILTSRTEKYWGDHRARRKTGWNMNGENTHHHMAVAAMAEKSPSNQSWSLLCNLSWPLGWVAALWVLQVHAEMGTFCSFLVNERQIIKYLSELFKFGLKELSYRVLT